MPIKKRDKNGRPPFSTLHEERINAGLCAQCGGENKRKNYAKCCKPECTDAFWKQYPSWQELCYIVKKRDVVCKMCGSETGSWTFKSTRLKNDPALSNFEVWEWEEFDKTTTGNWEVDHIKPIALGGEQWDLNNLQLLCHNCHAKKTAGEAKLFAKERRIPEAQSRLA